MRIATQKIAALLTMVLSLMGCAAEQNYRGVPSQTWEHLTSEQRQLIIDRAYQDEIK